MVQPGTRRETFLQMIGALKTVAPKILRIVPFGERHNFLQARFFNRCDVKSNGRAFDADAILLNHIRRIDDDLIVRLDALLDA